MSDFAVASGNMLTYADDMAKTRDKSSPRVRAIYDSVPKISSLEGYGNYLSRNPFSKTGNFSCNLSLDFVVFFIGFEHFSLSDIRSKLSSLNLPSYLLTSKKGPFSITHNGSSFPAHFITCSQGDYYNGTLLQINQPTYDVLKYIHAVLNGEYLISKVEFTADLAATNLDDLWGVIKNTLRIKWPGEHLHLDCDTIYANNIRNSRTIGARGYIKEKPNGDYARIEMLAKRSFFRKNGIHTVDDLRSLTGGMIFQRLEFCQIKVKAADKKISKESAKNHPQKFGDISLGFIAEAFYHLAISDNLKYGMTGMKKHMQEWIGRNVLFEQHPFHHFFFQKVTGKKFI